LFGQWAELSEGDRLLLDLYGRGTVKQRASLLPGGITFIEDRVPHGLSSAMRDDLEKARYRHEQHTIADEWLGRFGFGADSIERDAFERVLVAAFPEALPGSPAIADRRPKPRRQPARDRAKEALRELYPNGIPDQSRLSNKALVWEVRECLKKRGLSDVSRDTILRVANRQK
jgi:hypothetical protein